MLFRSQPNGKITRDNINLINKIADVKAEIIQDATYSEKLAYGKDLKIQYIEVDSKTTADEVLKSFENGVKNKNNPDIYSFKKVKDRTTVKNKTLDLDKFGFEDKLNLNTDAPFARFLPCLNFDELLSFEASQTEADRKIGRAHV